MFALDHAEHLPDGEIAAQVAVAGARNGLAVGRPEDHVVDDLDVEVDVGQARVVLAGQP